MTGPLTACVLLCLSLTEQRQTEIHDRLTTRGHLVNPEAVRWSLEALTGDGLAHVEMRGRVKFYRLASGQAVEDALEAAWGPA